MTPYMLVVRIGRDVVDERAAKESLDNIRHLTPRPSRLLVVDHSNTPSLSGMTEEDDFPAEGGICTPTLSSKKTLYDLADDIVAPQEQLEGLNRFRSAGKLKLFSIQEAQRLEIPRVVILRFGDVLHEQAPLALGRMLDDHSEVCMTYVPTLRAAWGQTLSSWAGRQMLQMPARWNSISDRLWETGAMIDASRLTLSADALQCLNDATKEGVVSESEHNIFPWLILEAGGGMGVSALGNQPLWYRKMDPSPLEGADPAQWARRVNSVFSQSDKRARPARGDQNG